MNVFKQLSHYAVATFKTVHEHCQD